MKRSIIGTLLSLSLCVFLFAQDQQLPPSLLIIGGGPAGLGVALEAKERGYDVTLIEKRDAYSREQTLLLLDSSLKLLKKWQVESPSLHTMSLTEDFSVGLIPINALETALDQKVQALGIKKIQGEFVDFGPEHTALISTAQGPKHFSYDIIVGADGTHSRVRECLGVEKQIFGTAIGEGAVVHCSEDPTSPAIDVTDPVSLGSGFVRRIKTPSVSVVFTQFPDSATKVPLQEALRSQGWHGEADALEQRDCFILPEVPIQLSQTKTFSHTDHSALLIGEAAASASFFQGMGANTALTGAAIAGHFLGEVQKDPEAAYDQFNQSMQEATDALIADSAFLFRLPS